jgi:hypothetical protein
MATMADVREHADALLVDALRAAQAGRSSASKEAMELGFVVAMMVSGACREAVSGAYDVATVWKHLRSPDEALGELDAIVARYLENARRSIGVGIRLETDRRDGR